MIWKPIPNLDDYEASDTGLIRSLNRFREISNRWGGITKRFHAGVVLKLKRKPNGYLFFIAEGRKCIHANRAIASTFHGPPPSSKHEAAHLNGNKADNRPDNIIWATPKENAGHRLRHGTHPSGSKNGMHRLGEIDIERIIQRYAQGDTSRRLALDFGVCIGTIIAVIAGTTWRHVISEWREAAQVQAHQRMNRGNF